MPTMTVRNIQDVPTPSRGSKAVREAQLQYNGYIQAINGDVGELVLGPDDNIRSVKVRLRRASSRLGRDIDIWEVDGKIYFRAMTKRGRPKKTDLTRAQSG